MLCDEGRQRDGRCGERVWTRRFRHCRHRERARVEARGGVKRRCGKRGSGIAGIERERV